MNKYHNKKCKAPDGQTFDSLKEASRWDELLWLERAGKISDLRRQVRFEVIPKQDGENAVFYVADFVYTRDDKTVVEDVKGCRNTSDPAYRIFVIKRKLMLQRYGIKVEEV